MGKNSTNLLVIPQEVKTTKHLHCVVHSKKTEQPLQAQKFPGSLLVPERITAACQEFKDIWQSRKAALFSKENALPSFVPNVSIEVGEEKIGTFKCKGFYPMIVRNISDPGIAKDIVSAMKIYAEVERIEAKIKSAGIAYNAAAENYLPTQYLLNKGLEKYCKEFITRKNSLANNYLIINKVGDEYIVSYRDDEDDEGGATKKFIDQRKGKCYYKLQTEFERMKAEIAEQKIISDEAISDFSIWEAEFERLAVIIQDYFDIIPIYDCKVIGIALDENDAPCLLTVAKASERAMEVSNEVSGELILKHLGKENILSLEIQEKLGIPETIKFMEDVLAGI